MSVAAFASRKRSELEQKVSSVPAELNQWRAETAEGKRLEKHHSQVRRLATQLEAYDELLRQRVKDAADEAILAGGRELEMRILELYRIWEFFRSKLALRSVPWLRDPLEVADDLAWGCYEPARARAAASGRIDPVAVKEPPLVFLNGAASPFTMSRKSNYVAEPLLTGSLPVSEFRALLEALPVPVIGLPWFHVAHAPETVVVCHEVGHIVEDDLGLTPHITAQLLAALAPVTTERHGAWRSWLGEIFADLYGVLAAGPAFVAALMNFLAVDRDTIVKQELKPPKWGEYPTDALRMSVNFEALTQTCFDTEAAALRDAWQAAYAPHAMAAFEADVPGVVRALLDGVHPLLGGVRLRDVIAFSAADQESAKEEASAILDSRKLRAEDPRVLLAAAALAFGTDPARYHAADNGRVARRVLEARKDGVRGSRLEQHLETRDREAGAALFARLAPPR
jgi:hypothetical protein